MSLSLFEYCKYLLLFFTWQINDNDNDDDDDDDVDDGVHGQLRQ